MIDFIKLGMKYASEQGYVFSGNAYERGLEYMRKHPGWPTPPDVLMGLRDVLMQEVVECTEPEPEPKKGGRRI